MLCGLLFLLYTLIYYNNTHMNKKASIITTLNLFTSKTRKTMQGFVFIKYIRKQSFFKNHRHTI